MVPGQQPWQVLSTLPAWQVTQIPRAPEHGEDVRLDGRPAQDRAIRRAQELVSAYCRSAPVAVAWMRERAGGPVRVITAGPGLAAGSDSGRVVLTLPAGARGQSLPGGEAVRLLTALPCWVQLAGVCDVLLAEQVTPGLGAGGGEGRPSLEDGLLSAWLEPFGWLLLAEPVDAGTLEELTGQVALEQLTAQRADSPRAKLAERRAAARHVELRQAASTGLWRVHLLAGAATPEQAALVAGLLRASTDLTGLPYALLAAHSAAVPAAGREGERGARRSMLDEPELRWAAADGRQQRAAAMNSYQVLTAPTSPSSGDRWPPPQPAVPFYGSTALVAALARMPAREVPGLRMVLRPEFDLTPETAFTPETAGPVADRAGAGAVRLGEVLDWNQVPCGDLALTQASLNRHVFVCGATGAGKSNTIRGLLEQATRAGIPWLVIEPAKAEYQLMAARLPDAQVIRIRPGDLGQPPPGINPLEPAAGPVGSRFPLQTHADLLRALFLAAFQADEPFPQVLSAALSRCYEHAGWDLVTSESAVPGVQPAYPTLQDLEATAITVVNEIGYGREVADNVRGFVTVRIGSLRLGTTGRFLDGGHPLDFTRLLDSNVVFEIEDTGDDRDKAFLMGAVLIRLTEHLRLRQRAEGPAAPRLRHLTVIEEAHRLLRQPPPGAAVGPAAQATEMFADLLAEVRAYGEGLVIAEQIPSKLITDVIKNTAVKIVHRLPAEDDRASVGATMNVTSDQSQYLVTLVPGEAAVFTDGMDYPLLARMPDGTRTETGPAHVASPAAIVTSRSRSCGPDCQGSLCTLRDIRAAQHALTAYPPIVLWAEYSVVAHLIGSHMPTPTTGLGNLLTGLPRRLRDCAIALTVDAAVASRAAAISSRISPGALAEHVTRAIRAALEGELLCDGDQDGLEPQWLAPPYRWAIVLDDLTEFHRHDAHAGPHPDTSHWEAVYGRQIPGDTCAAQLETVSRWYKSDIADTARCRDVILGSRVPSAIETATGARNGEPNWNQRLADSLDWFDDLHFPLKYLTSDPGGSAAEGQV